MRRSQVYSINHWVIKYALLSGCVHCGVGVCSDAVAGVAGAVGGAWHECGFSDRGSSGDECEFKESSERQVPSVATDNP
jgi:hypothetical protein